MPELVLIQPDKVALDGDGKAVEPERGYVWLEWIGQPTPTDSPTIQSLMLGDKLPLFKKQAVRLIAEKSIRRVDGKTRRIMRPGNGFGQIPHLSQVWMFGKKKYARPGTLGSYIQKVPVRDADLIKSSSSGKEFRVIGYAGDTDVEPITAATANLFADVFQTPEAVRLGEAEAYRSYKSLKSAMGW